MKSLFDAFIIFSFFIAMEAAEAASITTFTDQDRKLHALVLREMETICKKYWDRLHSNDPARIERGYWYTSDHLNTSWDILGEDDPAFQGRRNRHEYLYGFVTEEMPFYLPNRIVRPRSYAIKEGIAPSVALDWILEENGLIFLDCGTVVTLAFYSAVRKSLQELHGNDEKFDNFFKNKMILGTSVDKLLFSLLYQQKLTGPQDVMKGQLVYFINTQRYKPKHPADVYNGFNCIIKEPIRIAKNGQKFLPATYIGFGLDPRGVTQEEIFDLFAKAYNEEPRSERFMALPGKGEGIIAPFIRKADFDINKPLTSAQILEESRYHSHSGGKILTGLSWQKMVEAGLVPAN